MALQKVGVQMTADGAAAFNRAMADGDQAIAGFGKSAEGASAKVSGFSQIATGALRQVGAVAVNALADAGRAFVGFVGDSVKKAGDFEANMNVFGSVTGSALKDSGKSLKDFSTLFIQLGRDLPVSTAEVQQAAIELAKGGIDPATIAAGALRTSLNLAAAGGVGLADSANILSKQLGVWVDSAASAQDKSAFLAQTADLLSQAANVTTSDVSDMAVGLAQVGGVAKVAGLSFHETVQTMAELAPSFSSASDAGTSFKTFLTRLQPTTKPAVAAMTDLGLYTAKTGSAFYDAQGKFVGMDKAAALLQTATSGLTEAQRLMAFQTIFGTDAIRAAAIIAEKGTAGYDAMGKSMDAAGTVAAQAAARQQGLNTAWDNTQGSLEALQLTLGTQLIPMLTSLLNTTIAPAINAVTSFADSFFSAGDKVGFLVDAINTALPGFSSLTTLVGNVITAFGTGGLSGALDAVGAGLPAVMTDLGTFATSVGTWIVQQAPVWAAQVLSWGEAFIGWVTPYIDPALAMLGTFASSVGTWILTQAPLWGAQLLSWGAAFVDWITPYIAPALAKLGEFASSAWSWIVQQAPTWVAKLESWGTAFLDWIGPKIPPLLSKLGELATSAWQWVQQQAPGWLTKLETWGQSLLDWVGPKIPPLLAKLGELASSAWSWVVEQAPVLLTKLEAWGKAFIDWIGPKIPPLLAKLGELASQFFTWVGQQAAPLVTKLEAWGKSFIDWIGPATVKFLGEWPGFLNKFLDWIGTAAAPLLTKLGDWAVSFIKWVVPMIPDFIVALAGISVALLAFVGETALTLLTKLAEWGQAFGKWIKNDAIPALVGAWPGFWESLKGLMDTANTAATAKMNELGHAIVDGMKAGIAAAWASFTGWIHSKVMEIPAAVRTALGIKSPSKVMADEVGTPIVQGIQFGMLNEMPRLLAAMRGSMDSTIQEIVGWVDTDPTGKINQVGADAINSFIAGIQQTTPQAAATAAQSGSQIVTGMYLSVLHDMPKLLAAMRQSGDAAMKELVNSFDTGDGFDILTAAGDGDRTLTQAGVDAINRFIAGMHSVDIPTATLPIHQALIGLFTPPNTQPMIDALAAVHGTVQDLGALLNGNSTGNGSIEGDTKTTFTSIVDLTHQAWEQVRAGISNAVIDARATVDTATKAILQVSTDSFTKLRATSDLAWGQIHKGITDQITLTQQGVKLSTDTMLKGTTDTFTLLQNDSTRIFGQIHLKITDQIGMTRTQVGLTTDAMHKATSATWGLMGADAAVGWQKVKTNIETPVSTAKDTVAAASAAMQESMKIPPATQDAIFQTYRHVTDTIIAQLEKVTTQIDNVTEALGRLAHAKQAQAPDMPSGYTPPARALGGPVMAGMPYTVGERGRELFVPQTSGYVLPADVTQRISPPASAQQIAHNAVYNSTTYGPTFQIQAEYKYQSERSLMQDVRTMQLLYGST